MSRLSRFWSGECPGAVHTWRGHLGVSLIPHTDQSTEDEPENTQEISNKFRRIVFKLQLLPTIPLATIPLKNALNRVKYKI